MLFLDVQDVQDALGHCASEVSVESVTERKQVPRMYLHFKLS